MKKKPLELFVEIRQYSNIIKDQDGNKVSVAEARLLWEAGAVANYNLAFKRLATQANWDFAELARQYAEVTTPSASADGVVTFRRAIPRAGPFEMGGEADTLAGDLRGTESPMPETRNGYADQPWQSQNGQDAEESESLGNLAVRLSAVAERLEQAALRLASQAPPLAAPRPFQGRVGA